MKTPKNNTKPKRRSWIQVQSDRKRAELRAKAKDLVWIIEHGGCEENIHFLDTVRELQYAYTSAAAYGYAARDLELSRK